MALDLQYHEHHGYCYGLEIILIRVQAVYRFRKRNTSDGLLFPSSLSISQFKHNKIPQQKELSGSNQLSNEN